MSFRRTLFALLCGLAAVSPTAMRAETISLVSATDLNSLVVGQPVVVEVRLSGMPQAATFNLLAATIVFDEALLQAGQPAAGAILPSPLFEPDDFLAFSESGIVDGLFSTFTAEPAYHLSTNGAFFTVQFTPQTAGSGQLTIDFVHGARFNPADPDSPFEAQILAGAPVAFTVHPIPEPSSLSLAAIGGLAILIRPILRYRNRGA